MLVDASLDAVSTVRIVRLLDRRRGGHVPVEAVFVFVGLDDHGVGHIALLLGADRLDPYDLAVNSTPGSASNVRLAGAPALTLTTSSSVRSSVSIRQAERSARRITTRRPDLLAGNGCDLSHRPREGRLQLRLAQGCARLFQRSLRRGQVSLRRLDGFRTSPGPEQGELGLARRSSACAVARSAARAGALRLASWASAWRIRACAAARSPARGRASNHPAGPWPH